MPTSPAPRSPPPPSTNAVGSSDPLPVVLAHARPHASPAAMSSSRSSTRASLRKPVVPELVGDPGPDAAHPGGGLERERGLDVHVVVVDSRRDGHGVVGQPFEVVEGGPPVVRREDVGRLPQRREGAYLVEHPGQDHLAGRQQRAGPSVRGRASRPALAPPPSATRCRSSRCSRAARRRAVSRRTRSRCRRQPAARRRARHRPMPSRAGSGAAPCRRSSPGTVPGAEAGPR